MTFNELASLVAKLEGKKKQVAMGNVREIIRIVCNLLAQDMMLSEDQRQVEPIIQRLVAKRLKVLLKNTPKTKPQ